MTDSALWPPFASGGDTPHIVVERADGFHVIAADGRRYLDATAALWVNVHGHHQPEIDQAIRDQLESVAHSTLIGMSNAPAERLATMLVASAPPGLTKVFFSESGSAAVEVALKIAIQFWRQSGRPDKRTIVAFDHAYHGATAAAMSVGGAEAMHNVYAPLLFDVERVASPYCYRCPVGLTPEGCAIKCLDMLEALLRDRADEIACVIVEPAMQAAGGMIPAPPGHLRKIRDLCDAHDVLLVADEVAAGVGRSGFLWACTRDGVTPDLMAAGKALTGGYLPLAATLATTRVYDAFARDGGELMHGSSYAGNQLACAAAIANLTLLEQDNFLGEARRKASNLTDLLSDLAEHPHVGDVRQRGLMAGIEVVADRQTKEPFPPEQRMGWRIAREAANRGVLIRPLGDVIALMPPAAIPDDLLVEIVRVVTAAIDTATKDAL